MAEMAAESAFCIGSAMVSARNEPCPISGTTLTDGTTLASRSA